MFKGTIPSELIESIKKGECILFVGSGISSIVKRKNKKPLPTWKNFLLELLSYAKQKNVIFWNGSDEIEDIINKGNYLLAAQELQECLTLGEFSDFLNLLFLDEGVKPSKTHKELIKIPFRAILTTNYDNLLEGAYSIENEGKMCIKFIQEDLNKISSPLRNKKFFLFKIHGDSARPDSIVLGSRSYNHLLFRSPEYLHFIETLFTTHTVLFVGFGGSDIDFDFINNRLSTIYSRTLNKHYILLPDSKYNLTEKRRMLIDKRLEVIDYEYDKSHKQVGHFFSQLNDLMSEDKSVEKPEMSTEQSSTRPLYIISSKKFNEEYQELIIETIERVQKERSFNSWYWFYGYGGEKVSKEDLFSIQNYQNVLIIFDNEIMESKEIEFLFELITLREIEEKVNLIAISYNTDNVPEFLKRRIHNFGTNFTAENIAQILIKEMKMTTANK